MNCKCGMKIHESWCVIDTLESRLEEATRLLERAKGYMVGMADDFLPMPFEEQWLADFEEWDK